MRRVAQIIWDTLKRPTDLVARYGGEEFVCLLPNTELVGAMVVAETIRSQLLEQQIPHADSSTYPFVSVSLGACCKETQSFGMPTTLLFQADLRLYEAKRNGRKQTSGVPTSDRIVLAKLR
ncbi:diguanylate cyclase [Yersinia intermedia]|uniref:diguanylate cyclase n=1 Tax=Yersinia intermedia TaxID=631 RepID=UPI0028F42B72|nr:diguanylate cyclase [Yersinia intermedia]